MNPSSMVNTPLDVCGFAIKPHPTLTNRLLLVPTGSHAGYVSLYSNSGAINASNVKTLYQGSQYTLVGGVLFGLLNIWAYATNGVLNFTALPSGYFIDVASGTSTTGTTGSPSSVAMSATSTTFTIPSGNWQATAPGTNTLVGAQCVFYAGTNTGTNISSGSQDINNKILTVTANTSTTLTVDHYVTTTATVPLNTSSGGAYIRFVNGPNNTTPLGYQPTQNATDGAYYASSDSRMKYIGSVYYDADGKLYDGGTSGKFGIYNHYNKTVKKTITTNSATTWTSKTNGWIPSNLDTQDGTGRITCISPPIPGALNLRVTRKGAVQVASTTIHPATSLGLTNSSSAAQIITGGSSAISSPYGSDAIFDSQLVSTALPYGVITLQHVENTFQTATNVNFYGTGVSGNLQYGSVAEFVG